MYSQIIGSTTRSFQGKIEFSKFLNILFYLNTKHGKYFSYYTKHSCVIIFAITVLTILNRHYSLINKSSIITVNSRLNKYSKIFYTAQVGKDYPPPSHTSENNYINR